MTVYIDVLFILNLIINYFILLAESRLLHRNDRRLRIFLGALLGAFYSAFIFFPQLEFLYLAVLKLLASAGIVLLSFKISGVKNFLFLLLNFYLISMLFGGVMYAIQFFAAPPVLNVRNGVTYVNISPLFLILASAVCYMLIWLFSLFFHRDVNAQDIYTVEITLNGMTVRMSALLDSGNDLCDTISGTPVIIAEFSRIKELLPEKLKDSFKRCSVAQPHLLEDTDFAKRYRVVPYSSVGNVGGVLPAFRPDCVKIMDNGIECRDVLVAVTNRRLSPDGKFYLLLNPQLIETVNKKTVGKF